MGAPEFWNDAEKAKSISSKAAGLKKKLESFLKLESRSGDIEEGINLAKEFDDADLAREAIEVRRLPQAARVKRRHVTDPHVVREDDDDVRSSGTLRRSHSRGEREHEREQILEHGRLLGECGRKCPLLGVRIALPPTSGKVLTYPKQENTHV